MEQDWDIDLNAQLKLTQKPLTNEVASCFQLEIVPPVPTDNVQPGFVIVRMLWGSVDASQRLWIGGIKTYTKPVLPGEVMKLFGVGQIIFSKSDSFKEGDIVTGMFKLQKYCYISDKQITLALSNVPHHHLLGLIGVSGLTAYIGLYFVGLLKKGEKVVISGAAGAVGIVAMQLAKLQGCEVIGIVGSQKKQQIVRKYGGTAINYKKQKVGKRVKELTGGVDVYFDNVGGQILDEVLQSVKMDSRVVLCGSISTYSGQSYKVKNYPRLIIKRCRMEGFIFFKHPRLLQALQALTSLYQKKLVELPYSIYQGLDSFGRALQDLLEGNNVGKVVLKIAKTPDKLANL